MRRLASQISAIRGQLRPHRNKPNRNQGIIITYDQIPAVYLPSYGNGKINDVLVSASFDHEKYFVELSKESIPLLLNVFHVLQDISKNEEKFAYEEGIKLEFHNQLDALLNALPFVEKNFIDYANVEVIKVLFDDLKWTRNVITVTNVLRLESSDNFKLAIRRYFQEIWKLQLAGGAEDFLRDVFSAVLKIWEIKAVDTTVKVK
ncbi:hypothetical protein Cantr_09585 [Candida viswanathii]|uniref:Uncharacterized protein n=1 Tax=Candida viswanathii TaxID=5486 RepID=A0A367YDG5_9ASCO|nr:hypothetical protein Cantr_09585 [Candida viswanathii]